MAGPPRGAPGSDNPESATGEAPLHDIQFVSILRAKAEEAGRVVIEVDARHTSDRCEACGYTAKENRVSQAVFSCRRCGHTVDADDTRHVTFWGLDWPLSQPPRLREKKPVAPAAGEVT
jgi:Putative transposase DNA-binding domain